MAVANEIARQWGSAWRACGIQTLDADTLRQRLTDHDFTLALYGLQRLGADPDVYEQWHSSQAERGNNYAGLQDEQIDELLLTPAATDIPTPMRWPSYEAFQRRWVELAPSIMLYQPLFVYVATSDLEGLGFEKPSGVSPASSGSSELPRASCWSAAKVVSAMWCAGSSAARARSMASCANLLSAQSGAPCAWLDRPATARAVQSFAPEHLEVGPQLVGFAWGRTDMRGDPWCDHSRCLPVIRIKC